jgi:voltage-gated potassium channel
MMRVDPLKFRIYLIVVLLLFLLVFGTAGFMLLEGWSMLDSLYMAVITLSTVGFGEIQPLSTSGRVFAIVLIVLGVTAVAYGASSVAEYLLDTDVNEQLKRRRARRRIRKMENHFILCGFGRVGYSTAETLQEDQRQFVVIEKDPEQIGLIREQDWVVLEGDATQDEMLIQAGVEKARGLLVCTPHDADNLFIVLSARTLNPDIYIVARCTTANNEEKMRRAGANRVISPYRIGGQRMARLVSRPQVTEFLDVVTLDNGMELWFEEIRIEAGSTLVGKTVFEADLRRRTGITLVAMMRKGNQQLLQPDSNTRLATGDDLIAFGSRSQLLALEKLAAAKGN